MRVPTVVGTPTVDDGYPVAFPGLGPRAGASLPGLHFSRGIGHIRAHANLVDHGIPDFIAHSIEPQHLPAGGVSGPGGSTPFVKLFNGLEIPEVSSL